jgi:hypothetical protein
MFVAVGFIVMAIDIAIQVDRGVDIEGGGRLYTTRVV